MEQKLLRQEIELLRNLGRRVSEISNDPKWKEKEQLWKDKSSLKKMRPLILCGLDVNGWNEIVPPETLKISQPLFKQYEKMMKRQIYRYKHFNDDGIIENKIYVPYIIYRRDWVDNRMRPLDPRPDHSAKFTPCIIEMSDFKKMRFPTFEYDEDATLKRFDYVQEVFGDTMDVHLGEPFSVYTEIEIRGQGIIDLWCELRGMETVFWDLHDEPSFTKEAMHFLQEGIIQYLRKFEELGLLRLNNTPYSNIAMSEHSATGPNGLGCTDELPGEDWNGKKVRLKDIWGFQEAQEFTVVSAEMLEEFVLPYQAPVAELFGLNSYGCCENNDKKWDVIPKYIPRLRNLSLPFSCDIQIAAEKLKDKYVLCRKKKPVDLLFNASRDELLQEIRAEMEVLKDCHMVFALKDVETLFGDISSPELWTEVAMELAMEYEY